ncbi:IPTL-CTERM sorting domain-containing protein [Casimicrobium huifangae]|uniref:IPTL-CTERM sorting domain-containing protein n=1 Tax=Casimicrobium huifangae TaxID=2591109 RepID=UPI001396A652|nr:IPTL-CTERM sorting domain-containing protein [Casimicrobium huifangae]
MTPATAVFTISGPVNVTEGGATANAVVTCTGALDGNNTAITVPFTTTNALNNFTTSASPVTFTACAGATQNIVVTPRGDDATVQGPVSGTIVLGTPSAGSLGATTTATVNVADNDTLPVFGLVKAGACAEPTTSCTFTVVRESGITNNTAVGFTISGTATRGTDYTLNDSNCGGPVIAGNSITHTQAAPSGGFTIAVCPIDDTAVEGAETVVMTLNTGAGYTLGAVATQTQSIADDDSPQVVTLAVNGPVSEAGGVLTYTFTRSGGSAAAQAATLTVNTTAPATSSRYSTTCGASITFAASTSTATCTVTAIDNVAVDGNATATVAVAAPTVAGAYTVGSPSSATGTINDDDVAVNAVAGNTGSAASMGITEGAVARFSVSCPTLAAPFTVNYSIAPATPATGDVFVGGGATGSVTCPAAAASLVAVPTTVQTLDDSLIGNARTYTMTISVPAVPGPAPAATVIGNAVATVVVADNDQPTSIPTMGAAGLGLLSLMLAGLAAFQRRRRA